MWVVGHFFCSVVLAWQFLPGFAQPAPSSGAVANARRAQHEETGKTVSDKKAKLSFGRDGTYTVTSQMSGIWLKGSLPSAVTSLGTSKGRDRLGRYSEIRADYGNGRAAVLRLYDGSSTVLLLDQHTRANANTTRFPDFRVGPDNLRRAGYKVYRFAPIQFGKLDSQGPWLFFDGRRETMVLSPADNFLVSDLDVSKDGSMSSGIDPQIGTLPAQFSHATLLVFGQGVNHALAVWGEDLQKLNGKKPISNDADVVLNKFGYWTDNGANYYYKFEPTLGYEGTLLAIRDKYRELGVPIAYLQLDSWWYPKESGNTPGRDNGEVVYQADPSIFPDGLDSFHQRLGLPLVTHARWIAPSSPYRHQYTMSKNVVIDPRFWDATAAYLKKGGVVVYEQDWLDHNARPAIDIAQSHQFLASMAKGMGQAGLGIQYCMALPAYFMASTQFQNLRTIRVSDDHFMRSRYDWFLYSSALAHAVGVWPWSDVFMSSELPNLVLSTLSAGPVGTGDTLAGIDAANLKRVMRSDSVILKPDTPLVPIDAMYLVDSATAEGAPAQPMVASTTTDFGAATEHYVFSYPRVESESESSVPLSELGITGSAYAWDWVTGQGKVVHPNESLEMQYRNGWSYVVLAPLNKNGIALLGDTSKIVPLARKRFVSVKESSHAVEATVAFADGETSVPVSGYASHRPHVRALLGTIRNLHYDSATHLFTFDVVSGQGSRARVRISQG